jgi:hypothetical protein
MSFSEINDIRELKDFKGVTFSNFKKTDVQKELMTNLEKGKIEPACYWSSELICANHYKDLWEIIILFYSKYIHVANLKLALYLELRINNFKDIVNNGYSNFELNLRNNNKVRNLFCEIIYILCVSNRSHKYDTIKISKLEFDISNLVDKLKAPNTEFLKHIFKEDDPKDIFIAINELSFHLSIESKNIISSCYWIEWIIEYDIMKRNKKEICKCERRLYSSDSKSQQNIIWIIWDIFIFYSKSKSKLIEKTINACLKIFTLQYVNAINKKRKYILYFVVSLLCENSLQESYILKDHQKTKLTNVLTNLDLIYEQIKKNEYSPQTDYLFENIKKNNLNNTIQKLETLKSFENNFIPRT